MLEARKAAYDRHGPAACRKLASHGLDFLNVRPGMIVSGFSAIRDEIDPTYLLNWLAAEGFILALPVIETLGKPLIMRAWKPGDVMDVGQWGIAEPTDDKEVLEPDIVLVPLVAFDHSGGRLGYGGGYYDRTLAKLRAKKPTFAVGVAYDEQRVDEVPREEHDQLLDWVLTPSGPIRCRENK